MDTRTQTRWLFSAIKKTLKARKMTYRELAQNLKMTESGVKKMFSAPDCTLGRLNQICGVLGVSLVDLLQEQDRSDVEDVTFTNRQQEFFVKNMDCFRVFFKLAFERCTVEELREQTGLSKAETFRYLKKLDDIGLVRLKPGDQVQVPKLKRIRSFGDGVFIRKLYQDWSLEMMRELAKPKLPEGQMFVCRYLKMKKETYAEFLAELRQIEMEFLKRAVREMAIYRKELTHVRWVSAVDQKSFV